MSTDIENRVKEKLQKYDAIEKIVTQVLEGAITEEELVNNVITIVRG